MRTRLASRAGYGATVLVGLAASGLCAVAVARPWSRATATIRGLPPVDAAVDGADIAPVAAALVFVSLAGFGAVIATRGWVRRVLGIVIVVCAAVVVVTAVIPGSSTGLLEDALSAKGWAGGDYDRSVTAWRVIAAASAVVVMAAGVVVARFGGSWATMGARYDSPTGAPPSTREKDDRPQSEAAMWRALDDGADPTNRT
jgi:uncharacterized membrane protein (TIGR02234 family)